MFALVLITHTGSPDAVERHTEAHRAYLKSLYERGKLVASGPFAPRTGGALVLRVERKEELADIVAGDPFHVHAVSTHDVRVWTPTQGADRLEGAMPAPPTSGRHPQGLLGRVALVTGASSGIGEATALTLARNGAKVVLVARRVERLQAVASRIAGEGGEALPLGVDVAQENEVRSMVEQVKGAFGRLDILVNSAGVMLLAPVAEAETADWRRMIDLNLFALMCVTKEALPLLKLGAAGHIVNIASLAGRVANPTASAYAATKFGVVGFSESLRREVYKDKIRVTVVEPGMVATELGEHITNAAMKANLQERLASMHPLLAQDVAAAVLYATTQPAHVAVNEIVVRPVGQER
jgi:NADP-dependent 3-hydroxy acid dehydrogenase YdfG/uncharacterized protein YciI